MNTSNNRWYSFFFFEKATKFLVLIAICLVFSSYLGAKTPFLIANLSKTYHDTNVFILALWAIFYNFLFVYINRVAYQLLVNKYVRMLIQYARSSTYTKWLYSHEIHSDKYPQGEIISRIMSDTEAIRELVTSGAFGIFIDLSFVISCLFGFIKLHRFSGVFISLTEVVATFLLFFGSSLMRNMFMELRNSQAKVNRVTSNVLGGFKQIYYTRHDDYALKKSIDSFDDFLANQHKVNSMDAFYYAIAESMYPILLSLVVFIFPYSGITEGALIFAIVDLIQRSINPIKEISGKIANIQRARTGIDRITNFLEDIHIERKNLKKDHALTFKEFKVDIPHFEYKTNNMNSEREKFFLSDIKFNGQIGDLIGIVGLSGCGKSTLLNILSGNLKLDSGEVIIKCDQREISLSDLEAYQHEVSLVSQESHIFSASFQFNITMSLTDDPDFDLKFDEFKKQIPYLEKWGIKGKDHIDPSKLSLGQRQLIAGVRALYLNKNIVFFDEISSALDPVLELSLRKTVLLIQKNSLTIIVAHRIETIMEANKILVMEKGRIINSGIHKELINSSEVYQKFIEELSHS